MPDRTAPAIVPGRTSWNGIGADLGVIRVWIPDYRGRISGPFDMLAKFPQGPTAAELKSRDRPPVLVGLDFLAVTGRFKTGHLWALQNPQVNGC